MVVMEGTLSLVSFSPAENEFLGRVDWEEGPYGCPNCIRIRTDSS